MCCSSLDTYEVWGNGLSAPVTLRTGRPASLRFLLRTVKAIFSIHFLVRIIPRQKENRHSKPAGQSLHGDIRMDRGSQPPDSTDILRRSYLLSEQSPASSHSAPTKALDNNTPKSPRRQGFGGSFFDFFCCFTIDVRPGEDLAYIQNRDEPGERRRKV